MDIEKLRSLERMVVRFREDTYAIKKLRSDVHGEVIGTPLDPDAHPTHFIRNQNGTVILVLYLPNKKTISFLEQVPPNSTLWVSANEPQQYRHLYMIMEAAVSIIQVRKDNNEQ